MALDRVARRLLGANAPDGGTGAISSAAFFELVFGRAPDDGEQELLGALVGSVATSSDARAILLAFDQQFHPTTFGVRLSEPDLELVDVGDFGMWLDRRDVSVSAVIRDRRSWEPHVESVLRDLLGPGDTFVDVGANIGYHTCLAAHLVGNQGRVVAVDADSENCRLLWLNRRENRTDQVEIVPRALDSLPGLCYLAGHLGSNGGFVEPNLDAVRSGRGVFVDAARLDDVVDGPVHVIKVDVEGAEFRVIAGAAKTIERCRPHLIFEFSVEMATRVSKVSPESALQLLLNRGYELHVLDRSNGERVPYSSAKDLLSSWGEDLRIEDLLLTPQ